MKDLNKSVGVSRAVMEAAGVVTKADTPVRATERTAAEQAKGFFDKTVKDNDAADQNNVKAHIGGKSNGNSGKPMEDSIDGVMVVHFHRAKATVAADGHEDWVEL